ncbi:patatin-like phospholipase family protein [Propionivibrio sp.]|uniref:patatin-like phospholipase family protein n=1 Tax=Propionivibrio sp. TaxID=2212460 RepID=UPI003BF20614
MTENTVHYENVVFAGGGNRCFWQAGFWSVAAAALRLRPSRVNAVSAGSAIACALFAGTFDKGFRRYKKSLAANGSNFNLRNLLREQPVFPHGNMYREAILGSINEPALARLHQGPEINVLISCPPSWASPGMALLLGMIATGIDAVGDEFVHSSIGCRIGFKPLFISVRECFTPDSLADLIIASSCTPPLTPQARRNGIALLDGGLVSNVPMDDEAEQHGQTLVLLTRQFTTLPSIPGRTYVQPSQPIPVAAWDYTNDAAVQSTYDLGRRDGESFCASIGA